MQYIIRLGEAADKAAVSSEQMDTGEGVDDSDYDSET